MEDFIASSHFCWQRNAAKIKRLLLLLVGFLASAVAAVFSDTGVDLLAGRLPWWLFVNPVLDGGINEKISSPSWSPVDPVLYLVGRARRHIDEYHLFVTTAEIELWEQGND